MYNLKLNERRRLLPSELVKPYQVIFVSGKSYKLLRYTFVKPKYLITDEDSPSSNIWNNYCKNIFSSAISYTEKGMEQEPIVKDHITRCVT